MFVIFIEVEGQQILMKMVNIFAQTLPKLLSYISSLSAKKLYFHF